MVDEHRNDDEKRIHKDAEGQFAGTQAGGDNNGVASAKPTVATGSEDATVNKWPPGKRDRPKDWDVNFDVEDRSRD